MLCPVTNSGGSNFDTVLAIKVHVRKEENNIAWGKKTERRRRRFPSILVNDLPSSKVFYYIKILNM